MNLTHDFVAQALDLSPTISGSYSSITTDSRRVAPECLFVALKGDTFDGHDFIDVAISHGASAIILRKDHPAKAVPGVTFYRVNDTLQAFRSLAGAWRRAHNMPVICVAGSVGKTTTKEILTALLRGKWPKVLKTTGSQNGFVGIPMTLLEIEESHGAAVIEVGIDDIGAMEQHIPLVKPTASLITKIGPEHLHQLKDLPTVAKEESLALTLVAADGGLVSLNLDDPWLEPLQTTLPPEQVTAYTMNQDKAMVSAFKTLVGALSADKKLLTVALPDGETFVIESPLPGEHNAQNLLTAVAMAHALGLSSAEIKNGLKSFQGAEGRSEVRMIQDTTPVVCDYYNANPDSMAAGLALLKQIAHDKGSPQTWCCLGDMLELGPQEIQFHKELAEPILKGNFDHVFLYGPRMQTLQNELATKGFQGELRHFPSHSTMGQALVAHFKPKDALLLKGSKSMKMGEVWKILEAHSRLHWK